MSQKFLYNSKIIDSTAIRNVSLIKSIRDKIDNSMKDIYAIKSENINHIIFMLNLSNINEVIISFLFGTCDGNFYLKKVYSSIKIKNSVSLEKILEYMTSNSDLNFEYEISDFKVFKSISGNTPYHDLSIAFGIQYYIDCQKEGRVYYVIPSENEIDKLKLVYESRNMKKEYIFTDSDVSSQKIIPVEESEKKVYKKSKKSSLGNMMNYFGFWKNDEFGEEYENLKNHY